MPGITATGNGSDYVGLVRPIEKELCAVERLTGDEAAKKSGREVGAKYCWKNAMGDNLADSAKTTSVSRAWRRTAKWLHAILKAKGVVNSNFAMKKIFHYSHPPPLLPAMPPRSR